MENISEHISYEESIRSQEGTRLGIDNTPSPEILANMKIWAEKVFEPLRAEVSRIRGVDSPLLISSFYRCPKLNAEIGGALNPPSQHTKGEAGDIECFYPDFTKKDLFLLVKNKFAFDQLIWEFGDDNQPAWVHVSWNPGYVNRKEVLKATIINREVKYSFMP